jgi:hypothetical protein
VVSPIGDVGTCAFDETQVVPASASCLTTTAQFAPSNVPDGYPDYLVTAPGLTAGTVTGAGVAFVVDGRHGLLIAAIQSPEPQQGAGFGALAYHQAPGNLGGSSLPDLYFSAAGQDVAQTDQGRGYVFNGDPRASSLIYPLDDPAGAANGSFGVFAGLGDAAGADLLNEFALGRLGGGPVQIVSSCGPALIQTIPDGAPGSDFGAAISPMGDLNGDGYLDLAVGAPGYNAGVGRVLLMKSNGTPGPDRSCKPPDTGGGGSGGGGGASGGGGGTGGGATPGGSNGGKKVRGLARRVLRMKANKKTVKVGALLKFNGRLTTTKRKRSCRSKQKVALQRLSGNNFWATIEVSVTKKDGTFKTSTTPAPAGPFHYRAHVNQTKRCMGATSKPVKIKAIP